MTCHQCGGMLDGEHDRCWCRFGRFNEAAVKNAASDLLGQTRRELVGDALGVVEALTRRDSEALGCLLGHADLTATTVILGSIALDLLAELATWQPDAITPADLIRQLREGRA